MMRILGGEMRGRKLRVPKSGITRPSTGRLREALFSVLQDRVPGASVADLFAGSGSLGLEALSRGAAAVLFVERDRNVLRTLRANVEELGTSNRCHIRATDALAWMKQHRLSDGAPVDLAFADPPYGPEVAQDVLLLATGLVECGRIRCFCLEHAADLPIEEFESLRVRTRIYGQSAFTLLEGTAG